MISSDGSFSSPTLETPRRSSRLSRVLSPSHSAVDGSDQPAQPNTPTPRKPKAASKSATNGALLRERTSPDQSPQTRASLRIRACRRLPVSLQKELFKRADRSPVPGDTSLSPKAISSPQCLSKVLKRPGRKRKKASSLSDVSPCPAVSTGTLTHSPAEAPGARTQQTDSIEAGREQRLSGTSRKREKTKGKPDSPDSLVPTAPPQRTRRTCHLERSGSDVPSPPRTRRGGVSQPGTPCLSSTPTSRTPTDRPPCLSPSPLKPPRVGAPDVSPSSERRGFDPAPLEKTPDLEAEPLYARRRGRPRKKQAAVTAGEGEKGQSPSCSADGGPPAGRRRRKGVETGGGAQENSTHAPPTAPPRQTCRPRFQPPESEPPDQLSVRLNTDESALSSDLSIELSLQEDLLTSLPPTEEEEDEEEDEEELPSFLIDKKPLSITEGMCVWCKFRSFPFWPAMVKSVNRRLKKASIVFIDDLLFDKKRIRKGFTVALKTLKPFDCEEADQLVCEAGEKFDVAIKWCVELIDDYRVRIGCGSFTGSFVEYCSDDISCPVRRKYPQGTAARTFPLILNHQGGEEEEEEEQEHRAKKLLPDRSKAARKRANEKLVHFIVKQRKVEKRLLAVISGQQQSRWLRSFLKGSRTVVDPYLEDEQQLDQVYHYLRGVYSQAPHIAASLAHLDLIRFVLDVLLPEALIYAIAGVDKVSLEKAEDKYLKGPCFSKREREEFDLMIEQQMRSKPLGHAP